MTARVRHPCPLLTTTVKKKKNRRVKHKGSGVNCRSSEAEQEDKFKASLGYMMRACL